MIRPHAPAPVQHRRCRLGVKPAGFPVKYHLARCALFARNLGLDAELCAAEADWQWHPVALWRVAGEAAYVCWTDLGTRWARLIGHRGMLERIS